MTLPWLTLNGGGVSAEIAQAVTSAQLERTVEIAATLTVGITDPHRTILLSPLLASRSTATVDGVLLELVKVRKNGDRLSLAFEDAAVADLRRRKGPRSAAPGTTTRTQFARMLVAEVPWVRFVGFDGAETIRDQIARGSDADPDEDTWECLGRLAEDVKWRRYADRNTVYFGPDRWLLRTLGPAVALRENTGPVDWVDFDLDAGKHADAATVTVRMDRWALPPGHEVTLTGLGPADGQWMVGDVNRDMFKVTGTVELLRPQARLPEPVADPPPPDFDDSGPLDSGAPVPQTSVPSRGGYIWPVRGRESSQFGPRGGRLHAGLDIAAATGTPVLAARAGSVVTAGTVGDYGQAVYLDHGGGLTTRYAHMSRIDCRRGQRVAQGAQIGLVGSTGRSTGPHLHFEIRQGGTPRNPRPLLP